MQLNMGGGKTAVITPIVVAELCARDRNVVPRVMMLASLFPSQTSSLAFRLSGLLGTRLYAFPFRRDVPLDYTMVKNIARQLSQCLGTASRARVFLSVGGCARCCVVVTV